MQEAKYTKDSWVQVWWTYLLQFYLIFIQQQQSTNLYCVSVPVFLFVFVLRFHFNNVWKMYLSSNANIHLIEWYCIAFIFIICIYLCPMEHQTVFGVMGFNMLKFICLLCKYVRVGCFTSLICPHLAFDLFYSLFLSRFISLYLYMYYLSFLWRFRCHTNRIHNAHRYSSHGALFFSRLNVTENGE